MSEKSEKEAKSKGLSRREFIAATGAAVAGIAAGAAIGSQAFPRVVEVPGPVKTVTTTATTTAPAVTTTATTTLEIPLSKGYIVVDSKKCGGCCTCMLACSLAHEGQSNLSLSRIQIMSDSFGCFPTDITMAFCLQCEKPACYFACPLKDKALCIDPKTGVRYIDESKCNGCGLCIEACLYKPSRIGVNPDKNVALKCDLCQNTPYWVSQGKQACVELCPLKAIKFTPTKPTGYTGYIVNLRGEGWKKLGLPTG